MDERDVVRREPVAWFGPRVLAHTSVQVLLSGVFEKFADKREIEGSIPAGIIDEHSTDGDLWIDYVSDLGDGFDATATIAYLLAQEDLLLGDGERAAATRRGSILVMGGDEVYPYATLPDYEERLVGPYRAVLPRTDSPSPMILAIPGNHDWYDGLTAFLRVFAQPRPRPKDESEHDRADHVSSESGPWIGGWRTAQRRSYFAAQLPRHWWLWGIDIQLDTYIDSAQLEYFMAAAEKLEVGDAVILCCAKPSWLEAGKRAPEGFAVLDFFERTLITPTGAKVRLTLAGDHHAYVRYESQSTGEQKIMAGGGGAYLAATHHFPKSLTLPPAESKATNKSPPQTFTLASSHGSASRDTRYPNARQSRVEARQFYRILVRNGLLFPLLVAVLYGLLSLAVPESGWPGWRWVAAGLALVIMCVTLALLTHERGRWLRRTVAIPHAAMHFMVIVGLTALIRPDHDWLVIAGVVGGAGFVIGPLILGLYFFLADRSLQINTNELFASQRIERYKCFVRMHIGSGGHLSVHTVGVDDVCHDWGPPSPADARKRKHPPLEEPKQPIDFRLIDGPLTITREPGPIPG